MINTGHLVRRAMVVVDLWHYRAIAEDMDAQGEARGVALLNQQIQRFIDAALSSVGIVPAALPSKFTGDGKILVFESVESACSFADALQLAAGSHNRERSLQRHQRHFRVGICFGEIALQPLMNKGEIIGHEFHGLAVSNAARLEGACKTGEILICARSWERLPEPMKRMFGKEEQITTKHGEKIAGHRRRVVDPVADSTGNGDTEADLLDALLSRASIPHAKDSISEAIPKGIADVDAAIARSLAGGKQPGLEQVRQIISTAISHGAGIYNDGSPWGCARIYLHAATTMLLHLSKPSVADSNFPKGVRLAADWLNRIALENHEVDDSMADDLAWELRFAFDCIEQIPLFDNISTAIISARTLLGKPDLAKISGILGKSLQLGVEIQQPQLCAYLFRHIAAVVVWSVEHGFSGAEALPKPVRKWVESVRPVIEANARITRYNAPELANELPKLLRVFPR